jgi:hypothetical protein
MRRMYRLLGLLRVFRVYCLQRLHGMQRLHRLLGLHGLHWRNVRLHRLHVQHALPVLQHGRWDAGQGRVRVLQLYVLSLIVRATSAAAREPLRSRRPLPPPHRA